MGKRALVERLSVWLAALVCLVVTATLRDEPARVVRPLAALSPRALAALVTRVTANGEGVEGARVRVFGGADAGAVGELGEARSVGGQVSLDRLGPAPVWVVVDASGYARVSRRVELEAGEQEIEVALTPAESFEVVVVDAAQRPIKNAVVTLHAGDPLPDAAYTDPSGLAAFDGLGASPFVVEVTAQGFSRKLVRDLDPASSPLFVKLERESQLIVHVVDPSGAPAADATVLVAGSTLWPAKRVLTDDGGRAQVGGLPEGFYELRATRDGTVSEVGDGVMLEPGEQREVELHLVEGTFVEVLVTDGEGEDGKPVAQADVALVEGGLSSFPVYGRTDEAGLAKLGPIVGGDATASAQAEGFVPRNAVPVEQGQSRVRVGLLRAGSLTGRVVDERGYPIDGAALEVVGVGIDGMPIADSTLLLGLKREHTSLASPGPTPLVPRGELGVMPVVPGVPLSGPALAPVPPTGSGLAPWTSRRDGTFELHPVSPGRVQIVARHPAYVDAVTDAVTLGPGEHAALEVTMRRGGTVEGRVFEHNRRPVAGARIELITSDGAVERVTFSAEDGTFAFVAVPADVVLAVARPEEPETVLERLEVEVPAGSRREVEIALPPQREAVTFRVVDDRGFRMDRVEISTSSLDPATALARTAFTDETGEATVSGARGLPLRLVVRRRGYAPRVIEVERAPAELTLALAAEVSLEGDVRSRDGWLAGAAITLLTPSGDRHAKTDAGGRFRIGELAPGRARLLVTAKGHAFEERDIVLEPDSRGRVALPTIELARGGSIEGVVTDDRGRPVAGARVAAGRVPTYLPSGPLPPGVTQTDSAGRFTLVDVEPGETDVEAYKTGSGRASVPKVEVRAGESKRDVRIELVADPEGLSESRAVASLAITLSEHHPASKLALLLDHVPYGGEAQRAGLLAGDELTRVDGHAVTSIEDARARLDGPLSHDMVLELYRHSLGTYRVRVRREKLRP